MSMKTAMKGFIVGCCSLHLAACVTYDGQYVSKSPAYMYDTRQLYPHDLSLSDTHDYFDERFHPSEAKMVRVPESYHVGETHSPVSFKDRDRFWVSNQNPQSYTIKVADDESAAVVAQRLSKVPSTDRRAEVKFTRNGKEYYEGVYGNYDSQQEAQQALENLPPDIKQGAQIQHWGAIQESMGD
jgi:hypothetical protein